MTTLFDQMLRQSAGGGCIRIIASREPDCRQGRYRLAVHVADRRGDICRPVQRFDDPLSCIRAAVKANLDFPLADVVSETIIGGADPDARLCERLLTG